ncbi:MAG: hypothetical protein IJR63_09515 [Synergistaceae bacterium]|nr:hypothetical protein [Synergistaceae bacterium]
MKAPVTAAGFTGLYGVMSHGGDKLHAKGGCIVKAPVTVAGLHRDMWRCVSWRGQVAR